MNDQPAVPTTSLDAAEPRATRRRLLLRLAGAAATGVAASVALHSGAGATDGEAVTLGQHKTASSRTRADYTGATSGGQAFLFQAGSFYSGNTGHVSAALAGWSSSNTMTTGVFGYSDRPAGTGVYGRVDGDGTGVGVHGVVGGQNAVAVRADNSAGTAVRAEGQVAVEVHSSGTLGNGLLVRTTGDNGAGIDLETQGALATGVVVRTYGSFADALMATSDSGLGLFAAGRVGVEARGTTFGLKAVGNQASLTVASQNPPAPGRSIPGSRGEIDMDYNGDLWVCVGSSGNGTWRKLAGPGSAGSLHAITPARVYDSRRPTSNPLATGASRTVSVANSVTSTGAVLTPNVVPAGATAIMYNLTVINTVASGWLSVNPGGVTSTATSTINWGSAGTVLANGTMVALNATREITVSCGGVGAATNFIIDVTGYYR